MARTLTITMMILLLAFCFAACSGGASDRSANTVSIVNYNFEPTTLEIKAGQAVTWFNRDDSRHSVVGTNFKMESKELPLDGTFTHAFPKPGKFTYQCRTHQRMKGTIIVK